jgi:hypothetical protein
MPSLTVTLTKAQMQRLEKESCKRLCATPDFDPVIACSHAASSHRTS